MAGERASTATVLFTDLVGSTEIRRSLGDDRADDVRRRHDDAVRAAAAEHLGEVVKGTGDGLMVVFPAAAQGVSGAVAIQRAIARLNRGLPVRLGVRVGLSAGDVAWDEDDCFGSPVVEAARLCAAATEGQILTSEIVRLLVGSRGTHRLQPVGAMELKGLGEVPAFEVPWEPEAAGSAPLPGPLAATDTLPLIGRVEERETLTTAWKQALDGVPHVAFVSGEPGVGKTRLAAELARRVHAEGAVVLFGRCDEELSVPYQPFAEAVAGYAAGVDDAELSDHLGASGAELTRLVPGLATRHALGEPLRADPETERYRLFEAVTDLLTSLSADAPVLLLLDDVHWAAKPTVLLLRHVVRHRGSARLMVVATYRDTDLGRGHPLTEVLADLRREPDVDRVVLRGLDEGDVADLVATAAGHELDDATRQFARELHTETEGNPFFVGQVLRHLVESGGLVVEDGRWVVRGGHLGSLPEGVREVIGRRLSQLGPDTNEVLSVAAVIGREFEGSLLIEASAMDADRVLDALEEAEATRLIVPVSGRDDRRAFAHALVRSTLYEEVPTTRRLRIHRRLAHALEPRAARGVPCLDQLAHHSCEAAALGDLASALRWSRAAADDAFARLAYEESAALLERALHVLDPDEPDHAQERASLGVALARSLRASGANEAARGAALTAVVEARRIGRFDLFTEAALVVAGERGWSEAGRVDTELIDLLEEALGALPPGASAQRAMATARLGGELYFLPAETERRNRLTAEALAMVDDIDDVEATAFVLSCALWGSWRPDNAAERSERAHQVIELGRRSGNRSHEMVGNTWLVGCCAELGDGPGFRAAVARGHELAELLRQPEWFWVSAVHRAALALMEGRFDDAARLAEEGVQVGLPLGSETVMQMYGVHLTGLARARGGLEELRPLLEGLVEQFPLLPAWRCGLAFLYRDLGLVEEARRELEVLAVDDFANVPLDANWKVGMHLIAAVCHTVGDRARAQVLYDRLLPVADTTVIAGMPAEVFGSMRSRLALLAATLERWEEAEEHFRLGQVSDEQMGNRVWLTVGRLEWATALLHRGQPGDAERATELLEGVRSEAQALGMPRIEALASERSAGP